ncbi:hypothetical protein Ahy_B10g104597 isoform B [Arachis hypogaea]|uniref:Uncharacterized protein n=1 Tax=Arachis hypogaea TaxID=3818 RepID=A0A444X5W5_ARAHY|nr:hypothetical protein Ahy_B10g104597 isoform B [Arachis hypogaea]
MEKRLKAIEELKMEQEESIMIKKDMDRKEFLNLPLLHSFVKSISARSNSLLAVSVSLNLVLLTSSDAIWHSKANTTIYCQRIQEAITRQQAVPTPLLYRNPVLSLSSGHKVYRKSMATSPSKAVLGDVYDDDLVSSCSNGVDFTKPARVYFRI